MPEQIAGSVTELSQHLTKDILEAMDQGATKPVPVTEPPKDPLMASLEQFIEARRGQMPGEGQVIEYQPDGSFITRTRQEIAAENLKAEMKATNFGSIAADLDGAFGQNVPWGSVLVGAVPGVFVGEVIDGLVSPLNDLGETNYTNVVVKVAVAVAGASFGKQLIGNRAAMFFAGSLLVQVLADLLPLDTWVDKIVGMLSPAPAAQAKTDVVRQAEAILRAQAARHEAGPAVGPANQEVSNYFDDMFNPS